MTAKIGTSVMMASSQILVSLPNVNASLFHNDTTLGWLWFLSRYLAVRANSEEFREMEMRFYNIYESTHRVIQYSER